VYQVAAEASSTRFAKQCLNDAGMTVPSPARARQGGRIPRRIRRPRLAAVLAVQLHSSLRVPGAPRGTRRSRIEIGVDHRRADPLDSPR